MPPRGVCPWPIQLYTVDGFRMPTEKIPKFLSGEYMVEIQLLKEKQIMQGFQIDFMVLTL